MRLSELRVRNAEEDCRSLHALWQKTFCETARRDQSARVSWLREKNLQSMAEDEEQAEGCVTGNYRYRPKRYKNSSSCEELNLNWEIRRIALNSRLALIGCRSSSFCTRLSDTTASASSRLSPEPKRNSFRCWERSSINVVVA